MGTSGAIGIENRDGSVEYVTTPIDGGDMLPTLKQHYNTERKVRGLLALGKEIELGDSPKTTMVLKAYEPGEPARWKPDARHHTNGEYSYLFRIDDATWYWRKYGSKHWLREPEPEVPEGERVVMSAASYERLAEESRRKRKSGVGGVIERIRRVFGQGGHPKAAKPGTTCRHCKKPIEGQPVSFHGKTGSKHYHPHHAKHHKA